MRRILVFFLFLIYFLSCFVVQLVISLSGNLSFSGFPIGINPGYIKTRRDVNRMIRAGD